jgi:hypothetical protein
MKIGYAETIITPSLAKSVFLAGFGNNRRAETIHDELYVRALTIQDGSTTLVLTVLDLIGFFRADVCEVIQSVHTKHPDAQIMIASTHTHHGPDTLGLWGPDYQTSGVDRDYLSATKDKIISTILASLSDPKPTTLKITSVRVSGLVKNARNPDILDDELTLLQFLTADGKPQATLYNFPCHPEVLWEHNPNISSDYVSQLRDEVKKRTGAPCIFFSGALGGMLTPDVKDHSFEEADIMGKKLATAGLEALREVNSEQLPVLSDIEEPVIWIEKKIIQAKLTNILYKLAFSRNLLPDTRDKKGYITSEVNLIKIGGLWFATVPGELLPKLGLQLKAWMKAAGAQVTGVIGLANDELGYILPLEDFKFPWNPFRPGRHYEETNSIGKDITLKVMDALKEIIR